MGTSPCRSFGFENAILASKHFQNLLLQSDKVEIGIDAKLMDVFDLSNSTRVKEYEPILVSYIHAQRDSINTMQLLELFDTFGGEDCLGAVIVTLIKTANNSISRLRNVNYLKTLSQEDQ